ncbi:hypothetical protein GUJ93_ZPchr0001g33189 [Zizania palustris]|uniref:Uncharacterized protein n=1 Tax=Zizania palustris TaxID=103762 RepID=A0A8J5RRY0_ZIZPA|nr:hypothetical protein GUJ93_ZPchr0001g33189 [Zizania palustris]
MRGEEGGAKDDKRHDLMRALKATKRAPHLSPSYASSLGATRPRPRTRPAYVPAAWPPAGPCLAPRDAGTQAGRDDDEDCGFAPEKGAACRRDGGRTAGGLHAAPSARTDGDVMLLCVVLYVRTHAQGD